MIKRSHLVINLLVLLLCRCMAKLYTYLLIEHIKRILQFGFTKAKS